METILPKSNGFTWDLTLVEPGDSAQVSGYSQEELSFFVFAKDEDGPDEVEFLYLIQEEEELFWVLDAENWEKVSKGNDVWLGASSLRMPMGEQFPRENYRLVVIDKTGQRSEKEFYPAVKGGKEPVFPSGKVEDGFLLLDSPHGAHTLRVYNREGEIVFEDKTEESKVSLELLRGGTPSGIELRLVIFAQLEDRGINLRTAPIIF